MHQEDEILQQNLASDVEFRLLLSTITLAYLEDLAYFWRPFVLLFSDLLSVFII